MPRRAETERIFLDISILLGVDKVYPTELPAETRKVYPVPYSFWEKKAGCRRLSEDPSSILVWIQLPDRDNPEGCKFSRSHGAFSDFEVLLCNEIVNGASILWERFEVGDFPAHIRTAVNLSAMLVGISRALRGGWYQFWGTSLLISVAQQLTFRTYEGKPCTSGFICAQELPAEKTISKQMMGKIWSFKRLLGGSVEADSSFFEDVGSFRYVDGVNTFYLALVGEGYVSVGGKFGLTNPRAYSLAERASYFHLREFLRPGNAFAVVTNRNGEVDVVPAMTGTHFLRWTRGKWHVINLELIQNLLIRHLRDEQKVTAIIQAALALSLLRYGTIIFIPKNEHSLPHKIGNIDRSRLGSELRNLIIGRFIQDLVSADEFINVLSSDGMTIISTDGRIVDTGVIIEASGKYSGGGRTIAAATASHYGIALKVSEDGPISVFIEGNQVYNTS